MARVRIKTVVPLAREAVLAAVDNGLFHYAKSTSYSSLLCLVPITTSVAALLGQVRAESLIKLFSEYLSRVLPPGTALAVMYQVGGNGQKPGGLLVTALIFSILAASSVMTTLMDGFDAAYSVKARPFLRQELLGIGLVFLCATPLALASSVVLFGDSLGSWLWTTGLKFDPSLHPIAGAIYFSSGLHFTIAFGATVLLIALLYRFAPNRLQRWSCVWPGALMATILWVAITLLFSWYVRNISNYNVLYGSVGVSMALLIWMYLLSAALLVGCEFNAALERAGPETRLGRIEDVRPLDLAGYEPRRF